MLPSGGMVKAKPVSYTHLDVYKRQVHVCLPHYLHYPVSKYVAEHGVNVFCEKPVALNTAQAKEFAALETAHPEVHIGICLQNLSLIHI